MHIAVPGLPQQASQLLGPRCVQLGPNARVHLMQIVTGDWRELTASNGMILIHLTNSLPKQVQVSMY